MEDTPPEANLSKIFLRVLASQLDEASMFWAPTIQGGVSR